MTKGRRNKLIGLGVLVFVVLALILVFALPTPELSYDGKAFSDWIWTINEKPEGPEKEAARAVVRKLGSKSVPMLLKWLQEEDTPTLTERFDKIRHTVFFWLVGHHFIVNQSISDLRDFNPSHRAMAGWALEVLDPSAKKQAIPTLILLLGDKKAKPDQLSETAGEAYCALWQMAPESIQPLIGALTNQDLQVWALAAGALGNIGPEAEAAVPSLAKRLDDTNPNVRVSAVANIIKLAGDPAVYIPVVISTLPELALDSASLDYPLEILQKYPAQAKPAIPVLNKILNRIPSTKVPNNVAGRDLVTHTIEKIESESAD